MNAFLSFATCPLYSVCSLQHCVSDLERKRGIKIRLLHFDTNRHKLPPLPSPSSLLFSPLSCGLAVSVPDSWAGLPWLPRWGLYRGSQLLMLSELSDSLSLSSVGSFRSLSASQESMSSSYNWSFGEAESSCV